MSIERAIIKQMPTGEIRYEGELFSDLSSDALNSLTEFVRKSMANTPLPKKERVIQHTTYTMKKGEDVLFTGTMHPEYYNAFKKIANEI